MNRLVLMMLLFFALCLAAPAETEQKRAAKILGALAVGSAAVAFWDIHLPRDPQKQ